MMHFMMHFFVDPSTTRINTLFYFVVFYTKFRYKKSHKRLNHAHLRDFFVIARGGLEPINYAPQRQYPCGVSIFMMHFVMHVHDLFEMIHHFVGIYFRDRDDLVLIHIFHDGAVAFPTSEV